jgi:transposase
MQRRNFSREFKLEPVKLVKDRGLTMARAARDLNLHINVLHKWVSDHGADPGGAFPRAWPDAAGAIGDRVAKP